MRTVKGKIMESRNFEFLRPHNPELADLAGFAEHHVNNDPPDPDSALVKLRLYGENMVSAFFHHYEIPRQPFSTFMDLLRSPSFEASVPPVVLDKLHLIRIAGNKAAHGSLNKTLSEEKAHRAIRESFDLGKWFCLTLYADENIKDLKFQEPAKGETVSKGQLKREKKVALQRIAIQEEQMRHLLDELEETRAKAAAAEKTAAEQKDILAQANQSANVLQFDEATTRALLIDQMLVAAGWNVGPGEESTEEVGKEVEVKDQPTDSGIGYADYVLWGDEGKPLAVVEAKRTSHNVEKGRTQAKLYADGLEKEYGQRPVIFLTNGYDIKIWDDAKGENPRNLFGYYGKDSLERCHWKNTNRDKLNQLNPAEQIVDRLYQIEAIKRVTERFEGKRRKALLVQATGTGKTRVAVALCDLLIKARWVKRVLFLCDRRELRKQANNTFAQFIESEPRVYVTGRTCDDRDQRIYLATYPAMIKYFQSFDVGFFDLIIADESHRSIYNRYRDLFLYFDALQIGLTATPVKKITHNTFRMFDCEDGDPTASYSYEEAISDSPQYLAEHKVMKHTTKFLREGIKYNNMTDEEKRQIEEQVDDPELVDYSKEQVDKSVFNKDTDRKILRNLMENGLRDATDSHVGKTIIFARNHEHAMSMQNLFEEMYPQYMKPKKEFCAVIDNYVDRAEQLIDDFKGNGNNDNLHIAVSVDMLDTGIDVPEIVNLVFAKPVKSYVKFWQMIGRGTRLCLNLFGPGKHKEYFQIFDHWGNFDYFGEDYKEDKPEPKKSLAQQIFETRIKLAEVAVEKQMHSVFEIAVELIEKDVNALPDDTIAIREKWRQVKTVTQPGVIKGFDAATVGTLRMEIARLMQWRNLEGYEDAYRFDRLLAKLELALIDNSSQFDDFKNDMIEQIGELPVNLTQVANKIKVIEGAKSAAFWNDVSVESLEKVRRELRGIMHCRNKPSIVRAKALNIDVTDTDEEFEEHIVKLEGLDLAAYRKRVKGLFDELFNESTALQKIKAGLPANQEEITDLVDKVMLRDPDLKVDDLLYHFPNDAERLDLAIRQVIGLDAETVNAHFTDFVQRYPSLSSHQIRFLEMIKQHIANYGALTVEKLYEDPFTQFDSEGVDGVFPDEEQADALLVLIDQINELAPTGAEGQLDQS